MISACFQRDWNGFGCCFGLCLVRAVAQVTPCHVMRATTFLWCFLHGRAMNKVLLKKKEWCIFTADIYTAFTTKSALNSCSACHVGPKSVALPQDSCIWEDSPDLNMERCWVLGSCNTAPPQQLSSCTKGTRAFPKKTQTNHQNGDLELEMKKKLTPLAGLPCVVILCDCIREGGIPPSEDNQAKDQDTEGKQVWMNVA